MARFGEFETVRLIAPGALGGVYAARPAGSADEPTFAIRTFIPDPLVVGEPAAELQIDAFLAQAQAQARISSAVARAASGPSTSAFWAPIYDIGRVNAVDDIGGAYCVSDLAMPVEPSLAAMLRSRVVLDGIALGAVIGKVVHAVRLAKQHAKRCHGWLSPDRILLFSPGELAQTRLGLIDPLPDDDPGLALAERADLHAIGQIIYALVHFQLPGNVFRVADTRPWNATLGKDAKRWIDLVNLLLDPSELAERPSIEKLDDQLASLREGTGAAATAQRKPDPRLTTNTGTDIRRQAIDNVPKSVIWGATRSRELKAQTSATGALPAMPARGPVNAASASNSGAPVSAVGLSGAFPAFQPGAASANSGLNVAPIPYSPHFPNTPGSQPVPPTPAPDAELVSEIQHEAAVVASAPALPEWDAHSQSTGAAGSKPTKSKLPLVLAGIAVVAIAGAGTWWAVSGSKNNSVVPVPPGPNGTTDTSSTAPPSNTDTPATPSDTTPANTDTAAKPKPKPPGERGVLTEGAIWREDAEALADTTIPPVASPRPSTPAWVPTLLEAINQPRQRAIDDAIRRSSRGSGEEVMKAALETRLDEAKTRVSARLDKARALLNDLLIISDALDDGFAPGVDPRVPASAIWRVRRADLEAEPEWKTGASTLLDRLRELEALNALTEPGAIITSVSADPPPAPAKIMLAWDKLSALNWPAAPADFSALPALRQRALAAASAVRSPDRKAALETRINTDTAGAWSRIASSITDIPTFNTVLAARAALGLDDRVLTPELRVNARLAQLHADLSRPDTQDDLKAVLASFDRDISAINPAPAPAAKDAMERAIAPLRTAATRPPKPRMPPEGPTSAGASARASGGVSGDRATYQIGGVTFDFERLSLPDHDVFIQTREATLADVVALVTTASKWDAFRDFMSLSTEDETTFDWTGPRVWTWNGRELARNRDWLMVAGFADQSPYPQGVTKPRQPTTSAPMQAISANAAAFVAQLAGCRFPTSAEFAAALAASPTTAPNLWDASCDALLAYHTTQGWGPQFGQTFLATPNSGAGRASGSFVWYRTASDSGDRIRDLAGNVAEFVLDQPGIVQASGVDALRSMLNQAAGDRKLGVIGSSRLAPPGTAPSRAIWLADPQATLHGSSDAFSDVGFRLAFNAPVTGPESIKEEIQAERQRMALIALK